MVVHKYDHVIQRLIALKVKVCLGFKEVTRGGQSHIVCQMFVYGFGNHNTCSTW